MASPIPSKGGVSHDGKDSKTLLLPLKSRSIILSKISYKRAFYATRRMWRFLSSASFCFPFEIWGGKPLSFSLILKEVGKRARGL